MKSLKEDIKKYKICKDIQISYYIDEFRNKKAKEFIEEISKFLEGNDLEDARIEIETDWSGGFQGMYLYGCREKTKEELAEEIEQKIKLEEYKKKTREDNKTQKEKNEYRNYLRLKKKYETD